MVEHQLPKLRAAGSIPVFRSKVLNKRDSISYVIVKAAFESLFYVKKRQFSSIFMHNFAQFCIFLHSLHARVDTANRRVIDYVLYGRMPG